MTARKNYSQNWRSSIVQTRSSIRDALEAISVSGALMACALDADGRLVGIITDSDVRRHLLKGGHLQDHVELALNSNPVVGLAEMTSAELTALCEEQDVREIPVCERNGRLVDIFVFGHFHASNAEANENSNPGLVVPSSIFISAGGKGTRLRSVVADRPKPLALVGNTPMLETVIMQAHRQGFCNYYISVNYMAEMIEEHLSQRKFAHLNINIVKENEPLGTAGAIGLIANDVREPLLVTNADVLTTVPYRQVLRSHAKSNAWLTCVVRPHEYTVPFGVVDIKEDLISGIHEKPTHRWMANSGIYVLSPEACREIKYNQRLDMPELMNIGIKAGKKINPFILHEYWVDVGRPADFHKANEEFTEYFKV